MCIFYPKDLDNVESIGTWNICQLVLQRFSTRSKKALHRHTNRPSTLFCGRMTNFGSILCERARAVFHLRWLKTEKHKSLNAFICLSFRNQVQEKLASSKKRCNIRSSESTSLPVLRGKLFYYTWQHLVCHTWNNRFSW